MSAVAPALMRALVSGLRSGTDGLAVQDIAMPEPEQGELRVRVAVAGINHPDLLMIEDRHQSRATRPFVPGVELSGTVDAIGPAVTGWKAGDRLVALTDNGALAAFACVPEARAAALPDAVDFRTAAALPVAYGTMLHALDDRAALRPGETVLVLGGAGGIGLAAVQIARVRGARVVAAVSDDAKAAATRAAGADDVVLYPKGLPDTPAKKELVARFKAAAGNRGFDVIVDPVGGDYSEAALRSIGWHGRFLVIGFPAGIGQIALNLPLLKACQIIGVAFGAELAKGKLVLSDVLGPLFPLLAAGRLSPAIAAVLPLEQAPLAFARLTGRGVPGKILVEMRP